MLKRLAERGEKIDACVVGEPTSSKRFGDMMKIGRRGSMNVDMVVRGVQGHVGYPERLDNPIHRLSALIEALVREPIDKGSTHFQPTSLQFTTVDVGNKATNIAPGMVRGALQHPVQRSVDVQDAAGASQGAARPRPCGAGRQRHDRAFGRGLGRDRSSRRPGRSASWWPAPSATWPASRPELSTTGGTSDARFIRSYCPVLEFGLVGETMHKVDEKSAVADLRTLTRVYETVLDRYFAA